MVVHATTAEGLVTGTEQCRPAPRPEEPPDVQRARNPPTRKEGTAISRAMRPLNHVVERFIPSALVFSIVLTFIVAILGLLLTDTGPADLVVHWGDGLA